MASSIAQIRVLRSGSFSTSSGSPTAKATPAALCRFSVDLTAYSPGFQPDLHRPRWIAAITHNSKNSSKKKNTTEYFPGCVLLFTRGFFTVPFLLRYHNFCCLRFTLLHTERKRHRHFDRFPSSASVDVLCCCAGLLRRGK